MPARTKTFLLALLGALSWSACGDSTGPEFNPFGEYSLVTANGEPPPVEIFDGQFGSAEILAATLELREGGSCHGTQTLRYTFEGDTVTETRDEACTYELDRGALRVEWSRGVTDTGFLEASRITITSFGILMMFER